MCYKFLLRVLKGLELDHGLFISARNFQVPPIILKIRRLVMFRRSRTSRHLNDDRGDGDSLLTEDNNNRQSNGSDLEDIEADMGLPKYEDLMFVPANANMPPPYYSTGNRK